jgi:hypothetical protein
VWFVLSQPGVTAIVSSGDVRILGRVLDSISRFRTLGLTDQEAIIAAADPTQTVFA